MQFDYEIMRKLARELSGARPSGLTGVEAAIAGKLIVHDMLERDQACLHVVNIKTLCQRLIELIQKSMVRDPEGVRGFTYGLTEFAVKMKDPEFQEKYTDGTTEQQAETFIRFVLDWHKADHNVKTPTMQLGKHTIERIARWLHEARYDSLTTVETIVADKFLEEGVLKVNDGQLAIAKISMLYERLIPRVMESANEDEGGKFAERLRTLAERIADTSGQYREFQDKCLQGNPTTRTQAILQFLTQDE